MPKHLAFALPEGQAAKFAGQAERVWSEHLDLATHRIPGSNVERTLRATGLHRLIGEPAKPFARAGRRDTYKLSQTNDYRTFHPA